MDPSAGNGSVMIVAGEASGDLHGANLVKALRQRAPELTFFGIGGSLMREAGVRILVDAAQLAVVGITEVMAKLGGIVQGSRVAKNAIRARRPDLLVLIDFPDFNLNLAAFAKKSGIKVLYYVSPQIWAWRSGRVKKIKKRVDHMAVILPFEEKFYKHHGVPVTFVGHPLLDDPALSRVDDRHSTPADGSAVVGLLPGSRDAEIQRHLPLMLKAAAELSRRLAGIRFLISVAPTVSPEQVEAAVAHYQGMFPCQLVHGPARGVFTRCDLAVAVSGTVTLEAAFYQTPAIIVYRVSPLSYWMGRLMVQVKYIGLVNLIADRHVLPELIQQEADPATIARHAARMLTDKAKLQQLKEELSRIKGLFGRPGASRRVADIALKMMSA